MAYRTVPEETSKLPTGLGCIIGNEAAERFSFYGMKAILAVFLTTHLVNHAGESDVMSEAEATTWIHYFNFGVYFTPLMGAVIADRFFGKYKTIIVLSLVYCAGHLALALDDTRTGLMIGLTLIAFGAGGIKPCVSAHVGDQFGTKNSHLLPKIFSWFYFSINLGAFTSMLATPFILDKYGPSWAFGIPGILMAIATIVFWAGRNRYVHIPAAGPKFFEETFSLKGIKTIFNLIIIYVFVAMFWALFDQTASRWVFQAEKMDRVLFGVEILPSQMQSINSLLVMLLIPVFTYGLYPFLNKFFELTPLRKMAIGFYIAIGAFAVPMWLESRIVAGETPTIAWQAFAYVLITAAEILISITCLEFSYTQAPKGMKSLIMGFFLASVALGNLFTAIVNQVGAGELEGVSYYKFFTGCIAVTAVLFMFVVKFYKGTNYVHAEKEAT